MSIEYDGMTKSLFYEQYFFYGNQNQKSPPTNSPGGHTPYMNSKSIIDQKEETKDLTMSKVALQVFKVFAP